MSKGAPQVILSLAANAAQIADVVNQKVLEVAEKGYRALGVARTNRDKEDEWVFAGIIPLYDPPREDSAETLRIAENMGVQVKMVTGDHTAIAKETARLINLGTNILPSSTLHGKKNSESQRLVEEADVGIAVESATDAARSAAAIVLTLPGLSVIIDAIKESRKIFQRMNSYAVYRIAETIRVLFFMTLAILIFNFYPVTALMIVLLALLNDLPIMTIAFDNVKYSDKPEKWNMRVVLGIATVLGFVGVIESFGLLFI
ncbi:MAG: hypothetical protein WAV32_01065 [Halobacteriota archaeon]